MFGVKFVTKTGDPKFLSHPYVPTRCCSLSDRAGEYIIAGYGKLYKRTGEKRWTPQ